MSSLDTESGSPSIRDAVEASYASHTPSPDIDSIVSGAVEHRDREVRTRDRAAPLDHHQYEGDRKDRLRSTIRSAVHDTKLKAAAGPSQSARKHESPAGVPAGWDLDAKAQWHDLPQETRLAYQREQASVMNALDNDVRPHLERYAELDRVIAPSRAVFQQYGVKSDAEAVQRLFEWEYALRQDPRVGIQRLAQQLGVDLRELVGVYQQHTQQYGGDPQAQYQAEQAVHQHLAEFARGKPHFEAARHCMGVLIASRGEKYTSRDGSIDLDRAYNDAVRNLGLSDNRSRRAVSPPSRSPAVRHDTSQHSGGGSVRNSIMSAVRQSRGG